LPRKEQRDQAVVRAVKHFARITEPHVLRRPGQWLGWVQL
jgi:hypothetical protein